MTATISMVSRSSVRIPNRGGTSMSKVSRSLPYVMFVLEARVVSIIFQLNALG